MVHHTSSPTKITATAKSLLSFDITFAAGAASADRIVEYPFPEVAFWGRSNVGKSSLINGVFQQKIARTSNTPGRTQQLNFFNLSDRLIITDLPGYGFAKVPLDIKLQWQNLIDHYLQNRDKLRLIFLLVDSRHGLKKIDLDMMNYLNTFGLIFQVVVTKTDKVKKPQLPHIIEDWQNHLKNLGAAKPDPILTSVTKKIGMFEIRNEIAKIMVS